MRMKKGILGVAVTLAVAGLGLWSGINEAEAAPSAGPFYKAADALDNAPQGTPMEGYFSLAKNSSVGTNAASVVSATSPVSGMTNDAVQITTNKANQTGAIWSTNESFNLYKDQTASMWIFASGSKDATPGDGMAFVLQNAGDTNQFSGKGESLGVWGVDPKSTTSSAGKLADSAIKNSWALEFDTYKNNTTPTSSVLSPWNVDDSQPSSFDLGSAYQQVSADGSVGPNIPIGGAHIASNYPGVAASYQAMGPVFGIAGALGLNSGNYYYYGLTHLGYIPTAQTLADNKWHHITVDYKAPTVSSNQGSMTYTYDDKDPQTGLPKDAVATRTVPIDLTKFNLGSGQKSIRWGFTGSTGTNSESNLVVFDQIPGQAKTTASAQMTYEKDNQQVDVSSGSEIPGGSKVTLNYNAQRTSGDADWEGLNAELKIPDHITPDGTAKITYADGSTRSATVTKQSDGYAILNLAKDGSNTGLTLDSTDAVKVSIGGQAQNPANGVTYSSGTDLTSYFKGTNAVSTATTPNFSITYADIPVIKLTMDQSKVYVNPGQDAVVTGKVTSLDGSTLTDVVLNPYWAVEGETAAHLMSPITLSNYDQNKGFSFTFPSNSLDPGTYTLFMYAMSSKNLTEVIPITIVVGNVTFGSNSGDLTYSSAISGSKQIIERANPDWNFNINDTAAKGTEWTVSATASALTSDTDGSTLDGQLVYSSDGKNFQPLSPTVDTLITDHKSSGTGTPFDIASEWNDNTGILLQLNGGAVVGHYRGQVKWTLSNTADTQGK